MSQDDLESQNVSPSPSPKKEERRGAIDPDLYFNQQFDSKPRLIGPGQVACADEKKEMYVATVGSGVLVTMHDVELKIGAMAYMLMPASLLDMFPHFEKADPKLLAGAIRPLEDCITAMKKRGAGKHRIQIRLIGGAKLPGQTVDDAGTKNYIFIREYITRKGLRILNEDLGGPYVRRAHFFPETGRAVRMILRRTSDFAMISELEKKNPAAI